MTTDRWRDGARRVPVSERARRRSIRWRSDEPRDVAPEELAWATAVPAAALAVVAILVLGPWLGGLLFHGGSDPLWPTEWWETEHSAEPTKQARYLLAAAAPLLLAALVLWGARRTWSVPRPLVRALMFASQSLLAALVVVAVVHEHVILTTREPLPPLFGAAAIAVAAAIALAALVLARRRSVVAFVRELARDTTARRVAGLVIALGFAAVWLLKVPLPDGPAEETSNFNLTWTLNDAFAVLDGRTPLVDYHPIYAKLLPFPTALVLSALGTTTLVYTALMAALTGATLVAVYSIFRRLARSWLLGLVLFLPFVAVSDRLLRPGGTVSPMKLSAMWPMRYGGAYLLAWLTARQLERGASRRPWLLCVVAGFVMIDNLEFGVGAFAATVVALLAARPQTWRRDAARLALCAAAGLLAAAAAVCLLTLLRAGALPDPAILLEWPRIFTGLGWFALPLAPVGLHLAIYATFVGAIVAGAVRVARRDADLLLTGMLLWSGVFGLAAGGYFVGRPDVFKLTAILSAWSFALTPLVVVCTKALSASAGRRPQLAQLLVLFGFALSLTSLTRLAAPQHEIRRLAANDAIPVYRPLVEEFVRTHAQPGEQVAILVPMSFRIAYELDLRNVAPYPLENAIVTRGQMSRLLAAMRRAHVRELFMPIPGAERLATEGEAPPAHQRVFESAGYAPAATSPEGGVMELVRR